eukprot:NODE_2476_length_352_cov_41.377778_g2466_i0.p2 GENE.NODE_2476_length_352_cov_41.377778_g2466_i0~~NODE_2476_length_352_cov_41.377778_g2466_i0.p2  ORF type:complete len:53 (-),score=4.52 NODE_2476_length_352_cov_41.377778_g2466_i0:56-214(-)
MLAQGGPKPKTNILSVRHMSGGARPFLHQACPPSIQPSLGFFTISAPMLEWP